MPLLCWRDRLNTALHFDAAQNWYQYIFNPTEKKNPWQFLPLRRENQRGHGTLHHTQWKRGAPPFKSDRQQSLYFNGQDAYVSSESVNLDHTSFTIECWVKCAGTNGRRDGILGHGQNSLYLAYFPESQFVFGIGGGVEQVSVKVPPDRNWHHWAVVCRPDKVNKGRFELSLYLDGQPTAKKKNVAKPDLRTEKFLIGWSSFTTGHPKFPGQIAEVRIWNYARSAGEIKRDYKKELIGDERGLIRYWPLAEQIRNLTPNYARAVTEQKSTPSNAKLEIFRQNPLDPQSTAQIRPMSYRKAIGMHYIDNLIDYGDALFRRYTQETIVEATMEYVMAYDLLGERPGPKIKDTTRLLITGNDVSANDSFMRGVEQDTKFAGKRSATDWNLLNVTIADDHFFLPENTPFPGVLGSGGRPLV